MKKGIVLLITLMFIVALFALIIQNITSSEKVLKNANVNTTLVQFQRGIANINNEVIKLFYQNRSNVQNDEFWKNIPPTLPLNYGNIQAILNVASFDPDSYLTFDSNLSIQIQERYPELYLDDYTLKRFINEYNVTNQKQINFVLDKYIDYVKDDRILELQDQFITTNLPTSIIENNASVEKNYVQVDYSLNIDNLEAKVNLVFDVDTKEKKIYDISLQRFE